MHDSKCPSWRRISCECETHHGYRYHFWSVNGGKHLLHILYSFKSVFKLMYLPVVTKYVLRYNQFSMIGLKFHHCSLFTFSHAFNYSCSEAVCWHLPVCSKQVQMCCVWAGCRVSLYSWCSHNNACSLMDMYELFHVQSNKLLKLCLINHKRYYWLIIVGWYWYCVPQYRYWYWSAGITSFPGPVNRVQSSYCLVLISLKRVIHVTHLINVSYKHTNTKR